MIFIIIILYLFFFWRQAEPKMTVKTKKKTKRLAGWKNFQKTNGAEKKKQQPLDLRCSQYVISTISSLVDYPPHHLLHWMQRWQGSKKSVHQCKIWIEWKIQTKNITKNWRRIASWNRCKHSKGKKKEITLQDIKWFTNTNLVDLPRMHIFCTIKVREWPRYSYGNLHLPQLPNHLCCCKDNGSGNGK